MHRKIIIIYYWPTTGNTNYVLLEKCGILDVTPVKNIGHETINFQEHILAIASVSL